MKREGWDHVSDWYDKLVGEQGHYYHQKIILPNVLKLLKERQVKSLLDLGCGQGVLARALPKNIEYFGVDVSPSLIQSAKRMAPSKKFAVHDVTQPFSLEKADFDSAAMILMVQDLNDPTAAFKNAASHLKEKGMLTIVLNHPCFRVPRQSSWVIEEATKLQARKLNRYLTPLQIPIQTSPGRGEESESVTHHHQPLSLFSAQLREAGFMIELIEEWISDRESTGRTAKMENRARQEFPLFMCLICRKIAC